MRASRLLSILTTLQARGQVTAPELAEACEVSVRTIYRDIDALAAAGIPVYADRGAEGGYRLLDGYRVRLNGLSQPEAEALFMTGLPGPAAALGLDAAMLAAQTKLMAALPANLRPNAGRMQERFHLDAPSQPYVRTRTRIEETSDAAGWRIAVVPIGKTVWHAAAELLRLGAEAEVLAPAELRDRMAELTQAMAARYQTAQGG